MYQPRFYTFSPLPCIHLLRNLPIILRRFGSLIRCLKKFHHPLVVYIIKESFNVCINYITDISYFQYSGSVFSMHHDNFALDGNPNEQSRKSFFIDRIKDFSDCLFEQSYLRALVFLSGLFLSRPRLRYIHSSHGHWTITFTVSFSILNRRIFSSKFSPYSSFVVPLIPVAFLFGNS